MGAHRGLGAVRPRGAGRGQGWQSVHAGVVSRRGSVPASARWCPLRERGPKHGTRPVLGESDMEEEERRGFGNGLLTSVLGSSQNTEQRWFRGRGGRRRAAMVPARGSADARRTCPRWSAAVGSSRRWSAAVGSGSVRSEWLDGSVMPSRMCSVSQLSREVGDVVAVRLAVVADAGSTSRRGEVVESPRPHG